jgi:hypothetical protein
MLTANATDTRPSPTLLLASLGACTSTTLRLYTQRKGMDLQSVNHALWLIRRERHRRGRSVQPLACWRIQWRHGIVRPCFAPRVRSWAAAKSALLALFSI